MRIENAILEVNNLEIQLIVTAEATMEDSKILAEFLECLRSGGYATLNIPQANETVQKYIIQKVRNRH